MNPSNYPRPVVFAFSLTSCFLAACGGGGDGDNAINPRDSSRPALSAEERRVFEASKLSSTESKLVGSPTGDTYRISVNGNTIYKVEEKGIRSIQTTDARSLPSGFATLAGTATSSRTGRSAATVTRSYQGFRSGVQVSYYADNSALPISISVYGVQAEMARLPKTGKATYSGIGFDRDNQGTLVYRVDFGAKRGEGEITDFGRHGTIILNAANLQTTADGKNFIEGIARSTGGTSSNLHYAAALMGYGVEEIAGIVTDNVSGKEMMGFHGTRGEISQ